MKDRFVYFDLGNVLVHFDHAIAAQQLARRAGCQPEQARMAIFGSGLEERWETGLVTSLEFAREVNKALGTEIPAEQIIEDVSAIFTPNPSILDALRWVRDRGVRMGVLSNTCEGHWLWLQRARWPMLIDWFDVSILSYEVKSMKPAQGIYEACEQACGLSAGSIFFTDDRSDNIAAAENRGWATYQYGDTGTLVSRLSQWLS